MQILPYKTEKRRTRSEVRLENETVWRNHL
jgi:hypothetical protein